MDGPPDRAAGVFGTDNTREVLKLRFAAMFELLLAAMLAWGNFPGITFGKTIALLLLGSSSLWLRRTGWRSLGLRRPASWPRTIAWGVGLSIVSQAFDMSLVSPIVTRITGHARDVSGFHSLAGNVPALLYWLAVTWSFAAFGEEMVYRGYLLNRAADLFGRGRAGWIIAAVVSSLIFAASHAYQGMSGMIATAIEALIPVIAYFATGRNLWVPIILHGTSDTLGFIFIFLHK